MNRKVGWAGVPFSPVVAALLLDRIRCGMVIGALQTTFTSRSADSPVSRHFLVRLLGAPRDRGAPGRQALCGLEQRL